MKQEQTRQETDKKCPGCGGVMDFDPKTGGLYCPYCGQTEQIGQAEAEEPAQELDFEQALEKEGCEWGAAKKLVTCSSCGAQTIYDELEIANECPYCGSNQVMEEKGEKTLAPGGVVPFKLTAKEASGRFSSWIKKKLFCPRAAKLGAKPDAFKGVYLPYWTFDAGTRSDYSGEYGIDRKVRTRDGERTETRWYPVRGTRREKIDDQAVLASSRYERSLMRKVEPFLTRENRTYRPEYMAGFGAERYSVSLEEGWEQAKTEIERRLFAEAEEEIRQKRGADHVRIRHMDVSYRDVTFKYLLLPVWLSSYRYQGKIYHFMVNGQSGKAGGETPVSYMRVAVAAVFVAAVFLLTTKYWVLGCAAAAAAGVLAAVCRIKNL